MSNFKNGSLIVGLALGFILHIFVHLAENHGNHYMVDGGQSVVIKELKALKNNNNCPKCECPLDFQTKKIQAAERIVNENTEADDPDLIKLIQDYFMEKPPKTKLRNSHNLVKTTHAGKVLEILKNKVSQCFFNTIF